MVCGFGCFESHDQPWRTLEKLGYVKTGNDTAHPIAHTGNVPLLLQDGNVNYLADVLHVPNITKNITKNLVSVVDKWLSRVCR